MNRSKLNEKDRAILESLMNRDGSRFTEILQGVRDKTGISTSTLTVHLKQLEKNGYIKHHKNKYFLNTSKELKKQYKEVTEQLKKWKKKSDKLEYSKDIQVASFNLLTKIWREVYSPILFDLHCNEENLTSFQKFSQEKNAKRCEALIREIVDKLKKDNEEIAKNVLGVIKIAYL